MPRVIDAVPFFREQDIWNLRYETLRGVVDGFVVVEGKQTHSGQVKPLTFRAPESGPLIHYHAIDLPDPGADGIPATRRREMFQRNYLAAALWGLAEDDDIVLISDCDEIPHPAVVGALRRDGLPDGHVVVFRQKLCYYDLNTTAGYMWQGTRAARWVDVRALSPHVIRYGLGQPDAQYPRHLLAPHGGWHLSYFGGADAVQAKMRAFLHQELVSEAAVAGAAARIAAGEDAYGRAEQQFTRGPTDDVPPPVLADPARWRHLYHEDFRP
jgi:hypothetical protein